MILTKYSAMLRPVFQNIHVATQQLKSTTKLTRNFSASHHSQLRSSELTQDLLKSLRVKPDRLWSDIHSTAQWGAANTYGSKPEETGLSRLTLSSHDQKARDWFVETTRSLSCHTHVDQAGNVFAVRPGYNSSDKSTNPSATFMGSHLDSQPMGGRFDGVLGVCAGIEALRVLEENHIETEGPVGVVNWTNEEGARFPVSMMGSGVWSGAQSLDKMNKLGDVTVSEAEVKTVQEELRSIGYLGDTPAGWDKGIKLGGYFELHIEQGPNLVRSGEKVGVVEGVQAYKWFEVTVRGRACHTGTTGFQDRADALYWASHAIVAVRAIAEKEGGLASVGIIKSEPQSVNTVPEKVMFTLDLRHRKDEALKRMVDNVKSYLDELTSSEVNKKGSVPLEIDIKETFNSAATHFDSEAIDCVEASAVSVVGKTQRGNPTMRRMYSGAGHDAVNTNMRCPTAMIFVPCRDGVSHHPREWSEKEDCATGADVLLHSLLRFDKARHEKGHFS